MAHSKRTSCLFNVITAVAGAMAGASVQPHLRFKIGGEGENFSFPLNRPCTRSGKCNPAGEGNISPSLATNKEPVSPEGIAKGMDVSKGGMWQGQSHNPNVYYRLISSANK